MNRWPARILALLAIVAAGRRSRRHPSTTSDTPSPLVSGVLNHPWLALGGVMMMIAVGGSLVVVSGVVPIKASAGHWAITESLLQFAKRRSIAMHSIGIKVPPLDERALVVKGAGHFDGGCRPCHGRPDEPPSLITQAMLPKAIALDTRIGL